MRSASRSASASRIRSFETPARSTIGRWGVTGYPETFFVDRQGRLVGERIQGGIDTERNKDAFAEGVALALGRPQ